MDGGSDSATAAILLALAIKRKKERLKIKRTSSLNPSSINRQLLKGLEYTSENDFKQYLRMDANSFDDLLDRISPHIHKTDTVMWEAISARHRLSAALRFLVTGASLSDLHKITGIPRHIIGNIILETCEAIIKSLDDCLRLPPDKHAWKIEAKVFAGKWNFPNCLGVIGTRHIGITRPTATGSSYYNSHKFFSILLTAIVNANHQFLMIDVGTEGGISAVDLCHKSELLAKLHTSTLNLPQSDYLPGWNSENDQKMPFVFIGDETYPLLEKIMKPYSLDSQKRHEIIFNYRLSRAARTADNVLGILASRFRVLLTTINLPVPKVQVIVTACCYLHNYLIQRKEKLYYSGGFTIENKEMQYADWHDEPTLSKLCPVTIAGSKNEQAEEIRYQFCKYFNTAGEVKWQNKYYFKHIHR